MCVSVFNALAVFLSLSITLAHADVELVGCNHNNNFDIVTDTQPKITCTGVAAEDKVTWSIVLPNGQETLVAECDSGDEEGPTCVNHAPNGYLATRRTNGRSKLQFLDHSLVRSRSRVKCSSPADGSSSTCTLFVVKQYTLPTCVNNALIMDVSSATPVPCQGVMGAQDVHWIFAYPNGSESMAAKCTRCQGAKCPPCEILDSDVSVTREPTTSTLVIETNLASKDGVSLICSKRDQVTSAVCEVAVVAPEILWRCKESGWIKTFKVCDGNEDCDDASDENYCDLARPSAIGL